MVVPLLLQVLDRAGVTTGRVEHLHFLMGAVWVSSRYKETWSYEGLQGWNDGEYRKVEILHVVKNNLFTWNTRLSVTRFLLRALPLTVSTTIGRGRTVTESPPGLSSSPTDPGTWRPVSPGTPGSVNWT